MALGVSDLLVNVAFTMGGFLIGVVFEDRAKKSVDIASRRLRARRRSSRSSSIDTFRMGGLETPMLVIEGDGEHEISLEHVEIHVESQPLTLPADLRHVRDRIEMEQKDNRASGRPHLWNGLNYAVRKLTVSRTPMDEVPEICLTLQPSDYYNFLAAKEVLENDELVPGSSLTFREKYLADFDWTHPVPEMSSSFGVNVAVVTNDNQLVVCQRSQVVGSRPGAFAVSANEGLTGFDAAGRSAPSLHECARRAVMEELGITPTSRENYHLLAIGLDTQLHQWGCYGFVQLEQCSYDQLQDIATRGVPDKWENQRMLAVPFAPERVLPFILDPTRRNKWAPGAPLAFHLALVHVFGRKRVEVAIRRHEQKS
jgi:hypothetical protein